MIALRAQSYYVSGLQKYLSIIFPQGIRTSEGYKCAFISHCRDEHDICAELNLKENKVWSIPRRPLRSRSLVCSETHLFIVGIGPIRDKDL